RGERRGRLGRLRRASGRGRYFPIGGGRRRSRRLGIDLDRRAALGASAGCLGRTLLDRRGLLRGDLAAKAVAISLATDAVGLGILDARGVALDADTQLDAQIERLFVGEPQFPGELV